MREQLATERLGDLEEGVLRPRTAPPANPCGTRTTASARATSYSAKPLYVSAVTASPGTTLSTPGPTAATVP